MTRLLSSRRSLSPRSADTTMAGPPRRALLLCLTLVPASASSHDFESINAGPDATAQEPEPIPPHCAADDVANGINITWRFAKVPSRSVGTAVATAAASKLRPALVVDAALGAWASPRSVPADAPRRPGRSADAQEPTPALPDTPFSSTFEGAASATAPARAGAPEDTVGPCTSSWCDDAAATATGGAREGRGPPDYLYKQQQMDRWAGPAGDFGTNRRPPCHARPAAPLPQDPGLPGLPRLARRDIPTSSDNAGIWADLVREAPPCGRWPLCCPCVHVSSAGRRARAVREWCCVRDRRARV